MCPSTAEPEVTRVSTVPTDPRTVIGQHCLLLRAQRCYAKRE